MILPLPLKQAVCIDNSSTTTNRFSSLTPFNLYKYIRTPKNFEMTEVQVSMSPFIQKLELSGD